MYRTMGGILPTRKLLLLMSNGCCWQGVVFNIDSAGGKMICAIGITRFRESDLACELG